MGVETIPLFVGRLVDDTRHRKRSLKNNNSQLFINFVLALQNLFIYCMLYTCLRSFPFVWFCIHCKRFYLFWRYFVSFNHNNTSILYSLTKRVHIVCYSEMLFRFNCQEKENCTFNDIQFHLTWIEWYQIYFEKHFYLQDKLLKARR